MLTIICGEDTVASRAYFITLQEEYQKKGYFLDKIQPNQIEEVAHSQTDGGMLFFEKRVYVVQNLTSYTARKKSKEFEATMQSLIANKQLEIIDWEEKSGREIKLKASQVKEFKPSASIFQLQEACYPQNLQSFVKQLNAVADTQEEGFIFTMLARHTRTLLLAKTNQLPSTVPFWMKKKFQDQADKWTLEGLTGFYEGLAKLDLSTKTNHNIYGIKGSLELLGCYFLN
jgi:hypothetical protein